MEHKLIIETRNLSYRFGNQLVIDHVSLKVREGSIYGFLGPNALTFIIGYFVIHKLSIR